MVYKIDPTSGCMAKGSAFPPGEYRLTVNQAEEICLRPGAYTEWEIMGLIALFSFGAFIMGWALRGLGR